MITTLSWRLIDDAGAAGLLVVLVEVPGWGPLPGPALIRLAHCKRPGPGTTGCAAAVR